MGQGSGAASDPRPESVAERDDRNLAELIQELRVVSLGVQVLFGFLLSLPFTVRFVGLNGAQRDLYLASLVLSAVATVLLLGPVAYHRVGVPPRHERAPGQICEPDGRARPGGRRRGRADRRPAGDQLRRRGAARRADHRPRRRHAGRPLVRRRRWHTRD